MSSHLILSLQPYKEGQKPVEQWFDRGMRADSIEEIFADPIKFIEKNTYPSERWNVYFTVAKCLEREGRKLLEQWYVPFDIDGLIIGDEPDFDELENMARAVCEILEVKYDETGVLYSGNGLQLFVKIKKPILDDEYFKGASRLWYNATCDKITLGLQGRGFRGTEKFGADTKVWSPARIMRYPETENRKPGKKTRIAKVLQKNIVECDFDLQKISGLPVVPIDEQMTKTQMDMWPTPDVDAIMSECKFLAYCRDNPEKVSEEEWYGQASIVGRFPDGEKLFHKWSEGHPKYSFSEASAKLRQAIDASGPRYCKNINRISNGKCHGCKHHETKLLSPINIEGPNHVKTAGAGFYKFRVQDGAVIKGKPDFGGLRNYFNREHQYVSVEKMREIYTFNGKYFEEYPADRVMHYASTKFNPEPNESVLREFLSAVRMRNMVRYDFFEKTIEGKMNFQNGILDVKTKELLPHGLHFGFRAVLPCNYDPTAKAPRFLQFMEEITMGRQALIDILQEYMGYIFANGDCKYEKILFLLGTGENGKSKFIELIRALAGEHNYSSLSVKNMYNDQNRAIMEGKLVNIAEENSKDSFKDTEFIKNLASGGVIQVKRLFSQPYEYRNRTKLVMLCNEIPYTNDLTHGFFRKMLMIPFDQIFSDEKGNRDVNLLDKLMGELPGIFNFAMEGYVRLTKNGKFTQSNDADKLLSDYKIEADNIAAWAADHIEYDQDCTLHTNRTELYNDYRTFCETHGERPRSATKLFDFLTKFVKKNGSVIESKQTRAPNGERVRTVNHIKHLTLPRF